MIMIGYIYWVLILHCYEWPNHFLHPFLSPLLSLSRYIFLLACLSLSSHLASSLAYISFSLAAFFFSCRMNFSARTRPAIRSRHRTTRRAARFRRFRPGKCRWCRPSPGTRRAGNPSRCARIASAPAGRWRRAGREGRRDHDVARQAAGAGEEGRDRLPRQPHPGRADARGAT